LAFLANISQCRLTAASRPAGDTGAGNSLTRATFTVADFGSPLGFADFETLCKRQYTNGPLSCRQWHGLFRRKCLSRWRLRSIEIFLSGLGTPRALVVKRERRTQKGLLSRSDRSLSKTKIINSRQQRSVCHVGFDS
jgi:hypothetical protein